MKDRIKDYFAFNKNEQRGLIILLGLMLLSVSASYFMPFLVKEKQYDMAPFREEVAQFLASVAQQDSAAEISAKSFQKDHNTDFRPALEAFMASPFQFDPNALSADEWQAMGMEERIIKNIIRYRENGGKLRDK
ncbi:MAG: helix-hairpin-helix domain-containing protein [Bacteroidales bacterium]|nr:helix-hairpin-helix domain-containing protein [Bacteroidales bacterium]